MRRGRLTTGIIALLLAGLAAPAAQAQPKPVPRGEPPQATTTKATRGSVAVLRGLDKVAGTTSDLTLATGEAGRFGRLELRLGECRFPTDDPDSDAFAELTITDTDKRRLLFSGWMIASSPALSALDDARYDVWVIACRKDAASGKGPDSDAGADSAAESKS